MPTPHHCTNNHYHPLSLLKIVTIVFLIVFLNKNAYGFVFPNKDAYLNGMEQLKITNYLAATKYFQTALKLDPKNKDIINALASAYEKSLEFEKANNLYQKAILDIKPNQDKEKVNYLFNSGNNFFKMQHYQKAIEEYKQVLKIDDKNIPTKKNLELAIKKLNQENKQKNKKNKSDKNSKQNNQKNKSDKNSKQNNQKNKPKNSSEKDSTESKNNPKAGNPNKSNPNKSQSKDENKSSISLKRANEILKNFSENQANIKGFKFYKKEKSNKKSQKNW